MRRPPEVYVLVIETGDALVQWVRTGIVLLVVVLASPFALYAFNLGYAGMTRQLTYHSHLFLPDGVVSTTGIYGHMLAGAIVTVLAPLQLVPAIRRRWPSLHRASGYLVIAAALVAGLGGLIYIALRGTVGGPIMDLGFGLYGAAVLLSAFQAVRWARRRDLRRHRAWALRLCVLALASFLYRVHYGLWYLVTDGIASQPDFLGAFDLVQNFAFYVPYLLLVELYLRRRPTPALSTA